MQYLAVILVILLADQGLKLLVTAKLGMMNQIPVIENFFYIHCIPNNGIAMGLLADHQKIVIAVTGVIMAAITAYIFVKRRTEKWQVLLTLSLIVGGGIGNIIDRIRLGYVIDFIDFRVWSYIFNFADICVVVGCFLLLIYFFVDMKEERNG